MLLQSVRRVTGEMHEVGTLSFSVEVFSVDRCVLAGGGGAGRWLHPGETGTMT